MCESSFAKPASQTAAIVVTFNPDLDHLEAVLRATLRQVAHVYVVDNGDGSQLQLLMQGLTRTSLIAMGENLGIAAGQNAGVVRALRDGASDVLLMDQDSVPAPDMVRCLFDAREATTLHRDSIAAVGAASYGGHGVDGFVRIGTWRFLRVARFPDKGPVDCDQLIASGCLISSRAWAEIGPMDESLFIDKVDTDWCLRARHRGYRLLGAPAAKLEHRLGKRRVRLWLGRWREMPIHDASRYYYMLRNSLLLWRRPHVTLRWIGADLVFSLQLLAAVLIAGVAGKGARAAALAGIVDGWRGVRGAFRRPIR